MSFMLSNLNGLVFHEPVVTVVSIAVVVTCLIMAIRIMRFQTRFSRRWDSVDKRFSEVLWRIRNSDPEELRKRTSMLEEQLEQSMEYLRKMASAMDVQIESLRSEMKASLSKIDRSDSKNVGQSRMVIYQLERIRNQLKKLEQFGTKSRAEGSLGRHSTSQTRPHSVSPLPGQGYRMEAVFEPVSAHHEEADHADKDDDEIIDELVWEENP